MEREPERNSSIDIFRYVCAIMVIAIHTSPLQEINQTIGFIVTDVISSIGVPFFFIVSGYFYICKLQNGERPFRFYIKRLIVTYFMWSCLYFFIEFVQWGYTDFKGFILNCVLTFFIYGSSYHFWFFPALIFALCFTTFLWKIGVKKIIVQLGIALYIVGVLGCAYYNICKDIPVLEQIFAHPQFNNIRRILLMGFPFFSGGYLVLKIKDKLCKEAGLLMWVVSLLIWIAEIVIVIKFQFQQSIVITFGLYLLVISTLSILLQNPFPELNIIAGISRKLANFTYYTHPAFILLIKLAYQDVSNTALFFLTVAITYFVGLLICKIEKPILNKIIS